jgi:hypothetical protein
MLVMKRVYVSYEERVRHEEGVHVMSKVYVI